MKTKLLNISGKIDSAIAELLRVVAKVSEVCGVEYLIVGATARDLVLHYGYGVRLERASADIDFAIEVGDWRGFEELRRSLIHRGFAETHRAHRLVSPIGIPIDIVPFGDLAFEAGKIRWPDDPDVEMSVLGFEEARAHAEVVRVHEEPVLDIPVASPVGLLLLKLVAWSDRDRGPRVKDALDIRYLLENYSRLPHEITGIWNDLPGLEKFDGDMDLVAASLLGRATRRMASTATLERVTQLLTTMHEALVLAVRGGGVGSSPHR